MSLFLQQRYCDVTLQFLLAFGPSVYQYDVTVQNYIIYHKNKQKNQKVITSINIWIEFIGL